MRTKQLLTALVAAAIFGGMGLNAPANAEPTPEPTPTPSATDPAPTEESTPTPTEETTPAPSPEAPDPTDETPAPTDEAPTPEPTDSPAPEETTAAPEPTESAPIDVTPDPTPTAGAEQVVGFFVTYAAPQQDPETVEEAASDSARISGRSVTDVSEKAASSLVVRLDAPVSSEDAIALQADLAAKPGIELVEPIGWVTPNLVPADPYYASAQWNLKTTSAGVGMPQVWDYTRGSQGATVAVIDSGIRPHPDLNVTGGYDFVSNVDHAKDGNGYDADPTDPGWSGAVPEDCDLSLWHGTGVAGVINAQHNSIGIAGVAPLSKLVPVRAMGSCGGNMYDLADAIRWSAGVAVNGVPANPNPARVINLSLGGTVRNSYGVPYCPSYLQQAINAARSKGAALIVAAGNAGQAQLTDSPAICEGVINVAATNEYGQAAYWSDKGSKVTIAAPGQSIPTTSNAGTLGPGADVYAAVSGTSFAAPMVAGIASLVLSREPGLTHDQLASRLYHSGRPISNCSRSSCGGGLINAQTAVRPSFTDVPISNGFFYDIEWLKAQGITNGYPDGRYGVGDKVLREQMALFLYRASGSPYVNVSGCHTFADVPATAEYNRAVCWLKRQGITTGYSPTRYGVGDPVLREQMALFLYRASGSPAVNVSGCHTFADVPATAEYNKAVCWLKQQGITTGYSPTRYGVGDPVLREQMAAFIHRWKT